MDLGIQEKEDILSKSQGDFLELLEAEFGTHHMNPAGYSALGLAYIGDAVYDMIIRTLVLGLGNGKVKNFHKITSGIVKAESQAALAKEILPQMTENEKSIFRHGRNAKSATSAKNASIVDYRIATGLEALLGYLYLNKEMKRAMALVKTGLEKTGQMPVKL